MIQYTQWFSFTNLEVTSRFITSHAKMSFRPISAHLLTDALQVVADCRPAAVVAVPEGARP